uniref:Uncharacterized protein n=1 Tax=viral metagenome TaxID=1070528 RepID=A0A6C0FA56_9ZZZZ|tara:strand:+ start:26113 stop:27576 length:1464 start_codon:yes stop_codon:yes gene_type:complete
MTTYTSTNELFRYTIDNETSYQITSEDYAIILASFNKWDSLVTQNERFTNTYTIDVSFSIASLGNGILGGAQVLTAYYFDTYTFGNSYTANGNIKMNESYMSYLRTSIRSDNQSALYHVLLHEIGHILGIGTYWNMNGSPVSSYSDNGVTKYYYTGENALREYKSYIPEISHTIIGLPIEDNGGSGTQNVHPEEGKEGTASSDNRYINGYFHPGLDNELMSGWMESFPSSTPLSRISLGFLEDMGFGVDYNQVDNFEINLEENYIKNIYNMSNWLDLSNNANTLKSSYVSGFVDIKGGNLRTRDSTDHLMIAGDASFNQKVYIGGDISWNPSNLANNSIPISAVDSLIETSTFDFTIEKKTLDNNTGDSVTTTTIAGGYYYKIGKFVYVTYPRLTIANLNSGTGCALHSVSLPFAAAQKSSGTCMGAGINGVLQGTEKNHGIPTLTCSQGASKINTEFLIHSEVNVYNPLLSVSGDYLDITFNYIAQ